MSRILPRAGLKAAAETAQQILRVAGERNAYYWATQSGAELDLLLLLRGRRIGVEVKYGDAPRSTKSMAIARHDLGLDYLYVVYPGSEAYALNERCRVLGLPAAVEAIRREGR